MVSKLKGFTLLEVLAALAVVAIALVALLRLQLISIRTTEQTNLHTQAVLLAQQKLAELMVTEYPPLGTESGTLSHDGMIFHWQRDVRPFAPTGYRQNETSSLREVCASVRWHNGRQDEHYRLATLVAQRELP